MNLRQACIALAIDIFPKVDHAAQGLAASSRAKSHGPVQQSNSLAAVADASSSPWLQFPAAVGRTLGTIGVLAALAYFFGWVRTDSFYSYFGVDSSTLDMSTQDYLLRSVDGLFAPVLLLSVILLASWVGHVALDSQRRHGRHIPRQAAMARILIVLGAPMTAAGLAVAFGLLRLDSYVIAGPILLGTGVALTAYGVNMRRSGGRHVADHDSGRAVSQSSILAYLLVATVLFISVFWATASYAEMLGSLRAESFAKHLNAGPEVIVRSTQRLGIADVGEGIQEVTIPSQDTRFRYEYRGLRLLHAGGGKYFLLPREWTRDNGGVIVFHDSDGVSLEYLVHTA